MAPHHIMLKINTSVRQISDLFPRCHLISIIVTRRVTMVDDDFLVDKLNVIGDIGDVIIIIFINWLMIILAFVDNLAIIDNMTQPIKDLIGRIVYVMII